MLIWSLLLPEETDPKTVLEFVFGFDNPKPGAVELLLLAVKEKTGLDDWAPNVKGVLRLELDCPKVKVGPDGSELKVEVPKIDGEFEDPDPNRLGWEVDADVELDELTVDEKEKPPLDAPNITGDDAADENGGLNWLLKLWDCSRFDWVPVLSGWNGLVPKIEAVDAPSPNEDWELPLEGMIVPEIVFWLEEAPKPKVPVPEFEIVAAAPKANGVVWELELAGWEEAPRVNAPVTPEPPNITVVVDVFVLVQVPVLTGVIVSEVTSATEGELVVMLAVVAELPNANVGILGVVVFSEFPNENVGAFVEAEVDWPATLLENNPVVVAEVFKAIADGNAAFWTAAVVAPPVLKLALLPNVTGLTVLMSEALALELPNSVDVGVCELAALLPNWTKGTFGVSGEGEETFAQIISEEASVDKVWEDWVAGAAEKDNFGDECVDPLLKPVEEDPSNAKTGLTGRAKEGEAENTADSVGLHSSSDFLLLPLLSESEASVACSLETLLNQLINQWNLR
jgi:hypothetical protein